jgi:hypothetical protein
MRSGGQELLLGLNRRSGGQELLFGLNKRGRSLLISCSPVSEKRE